MTASTTHCWKRKWLDVVRWWSLGLLLFVIGGWAHAQTSAEISQFRVERLEDEVLLSAQIQFELPGAVEEALLKGIPMYFAAEAEVVRERWYWYDKKVVNAQRQMRLAYQPLTRRWRLNVTAGPGNANNQGLALNQSFDTLAQALSAIKRISRLKLADASELDASVKFKIDFKFRLDLSQLPRPFQIGALGQSDWDVSGAVNMPLVIETVK